MVGCADTTSVVVGDAAAPDNAGPQTALDLRLAAKNVEPLQDTVAELSTGSADPLSEELRLLRRYFETAAPTSSTAAPAPATTVPPATTIPPTTTTVTSAPPAPGTDGSHVDVAAEAQFLALTNATRASVGAPALHLDAMITAYARNHAQIMANAGSLYHSNISSLFNSTEFQRLAENVGVGPTVDSINRALVASPGHYTNLANPTYDTVGIGVFVDGSGRIWTVHVFGA